MEQDTQTTQEGHEAPAADVTPQPLTGTPTEPVATEADGERVEAISLDEARKLRGENKSLRQRLRDAEAKAANQDGETLSELERTARERDTVTARYDALVGALKTERLTTAAVSAAAKVGAIEPGAIARMIDRDAIEWDDDFAPENIESLVADLRKAHPKLFSAAPGRGDGGARDQTAPANVFGGDRLRLAYAKQK